MGNIGVDLGVGAATAIGTFVGNLALGPAGGTAVAGVFAALGSRVSSSFAEDALMTVVEKAAKEKKDLFGELEKAGFNVPAATRSALLTALPAPPAAVAALASAQAEVDTTSKLIELLTPIGRVGARYAATMDKNDADEADAKAQAEANATLDASVARVMAKRDKTSKK